MKTCRRLRYLHLAGNPVQTNHADIYRDKIIEMFPYLRELDGVPLREKKKRVPQQQQQRTERSKKEKKDKKKKWNEKQSASGGKGRKQGSKERFTSNGERSSSTMRDGRKRHQTSGKTDVQRAVTFEENASNAAIDALFTANNSQQKHYSTTKKVADTEVVIESLTAAPSLLGTFSADPTSGFVNVQEEKQERRNKIEESGGFAETASKFSGIIDSRPAKRRRRQRNDQNNPAIDKLLEVMGDEEVGTGGSGW